MHGRDEVQSREDRREAQDEHRHGHQATRLHRSSSNKAYRTSSRCRPRPITIELIAKVAPMHHKIETHQVDSRKGDIFRPQHHRQHEIRQRCRNRRDDKQEHHDGAVQREEAVIHFRRHPVLPEQRVLRIQQR